MKNTMRDQTTIKYSKFQVNEMDWETETIVLLYKREQFIPVMLSLIEREVTLVH